MKFRFYYFVGIFAIATIATSCGSDTEHFREVDIFEEFSEPTTLVPDKEHRLNLNNPAEYLVVDSLLFVLEMQQDKFIRCINLNTDKEIAFFLSAGRGPGELTHCLSLRTYQEDSIQVYGNPPAIMQFAIKDVLNGIMASDYRTFPIKGLFHIRPNALRLNEDIVLFPGTQTNQENENIFNLYDLKTEKYSSFGDYNPAFFKDMNLLPTQKGLIAQPFIEPHPDGNRFVSATANYKSIEVYDMTDKQLTASRYYELPKAEVVKEGGFTFVFSSEEQKGFSSIFCTKKAIYCYYTTLEDKQREGINKPVYIFAYDWKLRPLKCYQIEAFRPYGFVSADDRYVYASKLDPETEEYVFCRYEI